MTRKKSNAAEWLHVNDLVPWDNNPRKNEDAAWAVARSIAQNGYGSPIVVQAGTNRIISGHTRRKAVLILLQFRLEDGGWAERPEDDPWQVPGSPGPGFVPVRVLDISDHDANKLALSDNKTAELADWDEDLLKSIIEDLQVEEPDLDLAGWSEAELEEMFKGLVTEPEEPKTREVTFEVKEKDPNTSIVRIAFTGHDPNKVVISIKKVLEDLGVEHTIDLE